MASNRRPTLVISFIIFMHVVPFPGKNYAEASSSVANRPDKVKLTPTVQGSGDSLSSNGENVFRNVSGTFPFFGNFVRDAVGNMVKNSTADEWSAGTVLFPNVWEAIVDAGEEWYKFNTSADCSTALTEYAAGLQKKEAWAVRIYDASGKQSAGVVVGGLTQHGNYDECLNARHYRELEPPQVTQFHKTQYCSAFFDKPPWLAHFVKTLDVPYPVKLPLMTVDLCVPAVCTEQDIHTIITTYVQARNHSITTQKVECFHPADIADDPAALVVIAIFSVILLLVTLGTCLDALTRLQSVDVLSGETTHVGLQRRQSRLSRFRHSFMQHFHQIMGSEAQTQYKPMRRATISGYKPSIMRRVSNSIIRRRHPTDPTSGGGVTDTRSEGGGDRNSGVIPSDDGPLVIPLRYSKKGTNFGHYRKNNETNGLIRPHSESDLKPAPKGNFILNAASLQQTSSKHPYTPLRSNSLPDGQPDTCGVAITNEMLLSKLRKISGAGNENIMYRINGENANQNAREPQQQSSNLEGFETLTFSGSIPFADGFGSSAQAGSDLQQSSVAGNQTQSGGENSIISTERLRQNRVENGAFSNNEATNKENNTEEEKRPVLYATDSFHIENEADEPLTPTTPDADHLDSGIASCRTARSDSGNQMVENAEQIAHNASQMSENTNQTAGNENQMVASASQNTKNADQMVGNTNQIPENTNQIPDSSTVDSGVCCDTLTQDVETPVSDKDEVAPVSDKVMSESRRSTRERSLSDSTDSCTAEIRMGEHSTQIFFTSRPTQEGAGRGQDTLQEGGDTFPATGEKKALSHPSLTTSTNVEEERAKRTSLQNLHGRRSGLVLEQMKNSSENVDLPSPTSPSTPRRTPKKTLHDIDESLRRKQAASSGDDEPPASPRSKEPLMTSLTSIPEETPEQIRKISSAGNILLHNGSAIKNSATTKDNNDNTGGVRLRQKRSHQWSEEGAREDTLDKPFKRRRNIHAAEAQDGEKKSRGLLAEILLCFSFLHSVHKVMAEGNADHLFSLNGVRVLSISWIVLGNTVHLLHATPAVLANNIDAVKMAQTMWFQAPMNGTLAADSFFVLSGCLVTYHFLLSKSKQRAAKKGKQLLSAKSMLFFYVHRLMRILPCYYTVIAVYTVLLPYMGHGPRWAGTNDGLEKCRDHWWANALLFSNFFKADQMCMPWTYYLVNDFQFYLLSPLVLYPLLVLPWLGLVLLAGLIALQIISSCLLTNEIQAHGSMLAMETEFFSEVYVKPYCRVGAYAVGMALGYFLFATQRQVYFRKMPLLLGWLVAVSLMGTFVYVTHTDLSVNGSPWTTLETALYEAFSRPVWSIGLAWVIFTCSVGQGGFVNRLLSWNAFLPLCRTTYGVYLLHPVLISVVLNSSRYPFYLHFGSIIYMFVSNLVVAYCLAFFLITLIECPFTKLEALLRTRLS